MNPATIDPRAVEWFRRGNTGVSSETIFEALAGHWIPGLERWGHSPPSDPSDYNRCRELLLAVPEWRARLPEVAERHPAWRPFVAAWDEMERLFAEEARTGSCPKLFALMTQLARPPGSESSAPSATREES